MQILVVRVGRVGDTVMMTPALQAILQCYPDAQLTILASPEGKSLLRDFSPAIKEIWTWDRHGPVKSYLDKQALLKKISASTFDHVYCFDTNPRIAALFADISCPFHWFNGSDTVKHTAKHYLDLVASSCNKPVDNYYNYLPVDQEQTRLLDNELQSLGIMPDDIVVMMHPTFSGYTKLGLRKRQARIRKLWPAINYGELGKRLASSPAIDGRKIKSIIALLPKELSLGREIVQHSNDTITLLESQADFGRYKALLKRANLLLTPDSGPMHIASALGTRIVAFFSMKDPDDCGPYMNHADFTILRSDDPVQGIATIDVNTVHKAVMEQLMADISPGQHA